MSFLDALMNSTYRNLALVFILSCLSAKAEVSPSHAAAVERVIVASKLQELTQKSMLAGMEMGMGMQGDQLKSLPEAQQKKLEAAMVKVKAAIMESLNWAALKPKIIEVYARHYTESEANAVADMLSTPTGQMMVDKGIVMLPEMMSSTQEMAKDMMPKVMQIVQEEMAK